MNKDAVKPNKEQQQVIDTIDGPVLVKSAYIPQEK